MLTCTSDIFSLHDIHGYGIIFSIKNNCYQVALQQQLDAAKKASAVTVACVYKGILWSFHVTQLMVSKHWRILTSPDPNQWPSVIVSSSTSPVWAFLRSDSCPRLIVPRIRLSTIGDRSFRVTVAQAWKSLPTNVTASTSLPSFKRQLKTFLFTKSFPSL